MSESLTAEQRADWTIAQIVAGDTRPPQCWADDLTQAPYEFGTDADGGSVTSTQCRSTRTEGCKLGLCEFHCREIHEEEANHEAS